MCIIMICSFSEILKKSTKGATNEEGVNKPSQNSLKWNDVMDTILLDALTKE